MLAFAYHDDVPVKIFEIEPMFVLDGCDDINVVLSHIRISLMNIVRI